MLNVTLKALTSLENIHEVECYSVWVVAGFIFLLLICFVIFNERKRGEIKMLKQIILKQNEEIKENEK